MNIRFQYYIEYCAFRAIGFIVCLLPINVLHRFAFSLACIAFPILQSRQRVAMRNLRNAFPEKDLKELKNIALDSFKSVSTAFIELLWYPRLSKETLKQRISFENPEMFLDACNAGKGCIFVTAHFGSWEIAVQALPVYSGKPVLAIAKPLANPLIDRVIKRYREKFNLTTIPMDVSVREILKTLNSGGIVTLAADQAAAKESISVEFFGRMVPTFAGPAMFCLRTGAVMFLGLPVRQKNGNYVMQCQKVPSDDLTDASEKNIIELTQRHVKMTQEIIQEHPGQWMWTHKRWKHVPDRVEINS